MPWYNDEKTTRPYSMEDLEADTQADRLLDRLAVRQQQAQQLQFQDFMNQSWNEALKEAGVSQAEYAKMTSQDQDLARKAIKRGMAKTVQKVAQRFGRASQPQQQPTQSAPPQRGNLSEVASSGARNDDRLDDMLKAILPDGDPLIKYR